MCVCVVSYLWRPWEKRNGLRQRAPHFLWFDMKIDGQQSIWDSDLFNWWKCSSVYRLVGWCVSFWFHFGLVDGFSYSQAVAIPPFVQGSHARQAQPCSLHTRHSPQQQRSSQARRIKFSLNFSYFSVDFRCAYRHLTIAIIRSHLWSWSWWIFPIERVGFCLWFLTFSRRLSDP